MSQSRELGAPASVWPGGVPFDALYDFFRDPEHVLLAPAWLTIIEGLAGAVQRYEDSLDGRGSGRAARIAFGESLWWIATAEEYLRRIANVTTGQLYTRPRMNMATRMMGALVFARHRAGHQFADVLDTPRTQTATASVVQQDGTVTNLAVDVTASFGLRPSLSTPSDYSFGPTLPISLHPEKYGRDHWYLKHLAGKEVLPVLRYVLLCFKETLRMTVSYSESLP